MNSLVGQALRGGLRERSKVTTFQKNKFLRRQLMPGKCGLGMAGFKARENKPDAVSQKARRDAKASRSATCEQCGQVFKPGFRQRAKTCSRACHVSAMRKGGGAFDKAQRQCVPCLYRLGFGSSRIREALRIGSVGKHLARAGVAIDHAKACQVAARLGLNNKPSQRMVTFRKAKRQAEAALSADLKLLRNVIAEIRKVLRATENSNPERVKALRAAARERYVRNKPKIAARRKLREQSNPGYKMRKRLRRRMWFLIKTVGQKKRRSNLLLGCSDAHIKTWLQSKFSKGMTWENYGEWEVDHIIPCASFDLTNKDKQLECFHYSNLQPLWKKENRKKSDTTPTNHQPELAMRLN